MCACVCACVHACVHVCVRACMCPCMHVFLTVPVYSILTVNCPPAEYVSLVKACKYIY